MNPPRTQSLEGYGHPPFQHCPQGDIHIRGNCQCDEAQNFGLYFIVIRFKD